MPAPSTPRAARPAAALTIALAAALALPACSFFRANEPRATSQPGPPDTSLAALRDGTSPSLPDAVAQASTDAVASDRGRLDDLMAATLQGLESHFAAPASPATAPTDAPTDATAAIRIDDPAAAPPTSTADTEATAAAPAEPNAGLAALAGTASPEAAAAPADPPLSPEDRVRRAVTDAVAVLAEQARTADDPSRFAAQLAALEAVHPGAVRTTLDDLIDRGTLPPHQVAALRALRTAFEGLTAPDQTLTPEAVSTRLATAQTGLDALHTLRIRRVELCTKVTGFGQYAAYPSKSFPAGRPIRAIVYTELDHFVTERVDVPASGDTPIETPITTPDTPADSDPRSHRLRVAQELQLFHDADGLLAWRRPAVETTYTSLNKVSDYFQVDQITLPATLTVGAYRLKVIVRDLVGNAVAESSLPIRIVADGSAVADR